MSQLFDDAVPQFFTLGEAVVTTTSFSISVWFKTDDVNIDQTLICIVDASSANNFHELSIVGTDADQLRATSSDTLPASANTSVGASKDTWHNAIGVWASAADRKVWIDGRNGGSDTTIKVPAGLDETGFGRRVDSTPSQEFSGHMAYAAFWNVALTALEVRIIGEEGISPLCVQSRNLLRFDDMTEPITNPPKGSQSTRVRLISTGPPTSAADHPPKGGHIPDLPFYIPRFKGKRFKQKQLIV